MIFLIKNLFLLSLKKQNKYICYVTSRINYKKEYIVWTERTLDFNIIKEKSDQSAQETRLVWALLSKDDLHPLISGNSQWLKIISSTRISFNFLMFARSLYTVVSVSQTKPSITCIWIPSWTKHMLPALNGQNLSIRVTRLHSKPH